VDRFLGDALRSLELGLSEGSGDCESTFEEPCVTCPEVDFFRRVGCWTELPIHRVCRCLPLVTLNSNVPLISISQFVQVRTTFLAKVHLRSFSLTHHTDTRTVLPDIASLAANHESGILDLSVGKGTLLAATDTAGDLR
jgi:hypothetical protein